MIKLANPQLRFNFRENWTQNSLKNLSNLITKQTGFDYSKTIKPSLERLKTTENIPFIQNKDFNPSSLNMDTDYFIPRKIQRLFPKISLQEKCI